MFITKLTVLVRRWWLYHRNQHLLQTLPLAITFLSINNITMLQRITAKQRRSQRIELWAQTYAEFIDVLQLAINATNNRSLFVYHYDVKFKTVINLDVFLTDAAGVPMDVDFVHQKILKLLQDLQHAVHGVEEPTLNYYQRMFTRLTEDSVAVTEALLNAVITNAT